MWPPSVIGGNFSTRFHAVPFEIVELLYRGRKMNLKVVVGGDS